MKSHFKLMAAALLGAVAIVVSCNDPVNVPLPPADEPALTVGTPTLQIGSSDQVVYRNITVTATDAWQIASNPAWITPGDVTEKGFRIAIEPYIDGTEPSRNGDIVVTMGEKEAKIAVTQLVFMLPYELSVSTEEIPSALADQTYDVEVTASHSWNADPDKDWLHVTDVTETGFRISVDAYGDAVGPQRSGKVVVSSRDTDIEITVTQLKPDPDAIPLADYLGEYTITAQEGSNLNSTFSGHFEGTRPYSRMGTMRRSEFGPNWVSINVLGSDLYFTYDPVTGTLKSNNYVDGVWACTFSHFNHHQLNEWTPPSNIFFAFDDGSMTFEMDGDGKIVVPATIDVPSTIVNIGGLNVDVGGDDKPICICQFNIQHHITMSNYLRDITFTKK